MLPITTESFNCQLACKSYFLPDGVQNYKVGGTNYIVTANEGDEKDLAGFSERTTVGANDYTLDPAIFPQASF
jgi:hypothetical protein